MATEVCKDKLGLPGWWDGWGVALAGAWELSGEERARYQETILGFEAFCQQHGGASVERAREFVREQVGRGAAPEVVQGWKEALNWWFRRVSEGVKPLLCISPLSHANIPLPPRAHPQHLASHSPAHGQTIALGLGWGGTGQWLDLGWGRCRGSSALARGTRRGSMV